MTTGPEDAGTAAAGRVHRGASQADREGVIEALKAAFVVGRLTEGELEVRAGQAFAARSQADLAAITADIPVGPVAARPARMPDRVVAGGTGVIIAAAALGGAVLVGGPALILWAITMAGVLLFTVSLLLAVRQERRTRGRRPPRAALAGPSGPALEGPPLEGEGSGHDYYALRSYLPRSRTVPWHRVVTLTGCAGPTTRPCLSWSAWPTARSTATRWPRTSRASPG